MVVLGKEYQESIDLLMKDVKSNPKNPRYMEEFLYNENECKTPIHVFLWNPIETFGVKISCLKHNSVLKGADWTSNTLDNKGRSPRLIYCVFYNVLLIQRYYRCGHSGKDQCILGSSTLSFMELLNEELFKKFPYKMYHQSAYSFKFINFVFEMLAGGNNFKAISQTVANLKATHFGPLNGLNDLMMSFPASGRIETLFLDIFQTRKHHYKLALERIKPEKVISFDQSFKLPQNIGGKRKADGKIFIEQKRLFLALDENQKVVTWKMVKSDTLDEAHDILTDLKERCKDIFTVVTGNCCRDRSTYQHYFGYVSVKLDPRQAAYRLKEIASITKVTPNSSKFISGLKYLFREDGDVDAVRKKPIPDRETIHGNIDQFLEINSNFISSLSKGEEFEAEIVILKTHVEQDCLSDLDVGQSTEGIEVLHKMLEKSCLRDASVVSPELMEAIITLLIYHYNCKIDGKNHKCNVSIVPVFLPEDMNKEDMSLLISHPSIAITDDEEERKSILEKALTQIQIVIKTVKSIQNVCKLRLSAEEVLSNSSPGELPDHEDSHDAQVLFNLSAFGLQSDSLEQHCAFKVVLLQLYQFVNFGREGVLVEHFKKIGLTGDVEQDSNYLRTLCNESSDDDGTRIDETSLNDNLIISACSNILRIPILIIQPFQRLSFHTLLPKEQLTETPIVLTYHSVSKRMLGTKPMDTLVVETKKTSKDKSLDIGQESDDESTPVPCHCKKGCTRDGKWKKCPCASAERSCTKKCFCRNCSNGKPACEPHGNGCRCEKGCINIDGHPRSRCPCLLSGVSCSNCKCKTCKNPFGQREERERRQDKSLDIGQESDDESTLAKCHCKQRCTKENLGKGKRQCPCVLKGLDCSNKCLCRECQNNKKIKRNADGCRCRTGCHSGDSGDERKRKSKCPCLKLAISCENCSCTNCKNPHGARVVVLDSGNKKRQIRNRKSHTTYKKVRTEDYLATLSNITPCASLGQGSWDLEEIACLYVSTMWILQIHSLYDTEKIHELYHFFLNEESIGKVISLKTKTLKQVTEKLFTMRFVNDEFFIPNHDSQ